MASNHTANYNLSQWEENDEVLRADFNADNLKIDTAIKAALDAAALAQGAAGAVADAYTPQNKPYVLGTYTGNAPGAPSTPSYQTISLGFTPSFVHVFDSLCYPTYNHTSPNSAQRTGSAAAGMPLALDGMAILEVVEGGFRAAYWWREGNPVYPNLNISGATHYYIAFR